LTETTQTGVAEDVEIDDDSNFSMQDWFDKAGPMKNLRRGEVVEGTIMGIQRDGVLVDMGAKSEGLIPANEMHSLGAAPLTKVAVGEKVLVYIVQPEADEGHVLLSIDKARGERGWRVLQTRFEEAEASGSRPPSARACG
jgi:small subunit ribosomal protein S1